MLFVDNIILWVVVGYGGLGCCSHVVDGIGASGCKKAQEGARSTFFYFEGGLLHCL